MDMDIGGRSIMEICPEAKTCFTSAELLLSIGTKKLIDAATEELRASNINQAGAIGRLRAEVTSLRQELDEVRSKLARPKRGGARGPYEKRGKLPEGVDNTTKALMAEAYSDGKRSKVRAMREEDLDE